MSKKKQPLPSSHVFTPPGFTKKMKETHKILAPDIFPIHMELIKQIFLMYGYDLEILKSRGKHVVDKGLEHVHNDMCYPAICMTGQQLHALTSGEYDPHRCALIQFQTGGGCRASNYIWLLRKALHNMRMDDVPVISVSFTGMEKCDGFKITPMMISKAMVAIIYGDMLMLLRNQVRPYEVNAGDCQRVIDKWYAELASQFRRNQGLFGKRFRQNLYRIARDFHEIPRKNEKKIRVGIVGEIYVKYSPFGNNGLEEFLDSQGCEYMVPGVLGFFQFMFDNKQTDYRLYGTGRKSALISRAGMRLTNRIERTFREVLSEFPEFQTPTSFESIRALGDRVIGRGVKMGEGWLLPAEVAELIEKGYSNVICAQPFGCLPNHVVGKGTIRTLRQMYPNANIFPIDYDAGASKVNQENRIKLMLALARDAQTNESEVPQ